MAAKADSYVSGISDAPLLGETIGASLDKAVQRWADREALVSPSHDVRWTWKEFAVPQQEPLKGRGLELLVANVVKVGG